MSRLGLTIPLHGLPLSAHRDILCELLDLGYTDLWTQETAGLDPFASLAAVTDASGDARLGVAIAGVFSRGPGVLAMQAATLAELAPGRFVLGLGSSSDRMVEGWNAARFERPVERVRDSVRFLRRALAGERVDQEYVGFRIRGFQLERPPALPPPIYVAALRPRMLAVAGSEADGLCLSLVTPEDVARVVEEARRSGPVTDVVLRLAVCPTADAERARASARRMLGAYLNAPAYARFHAWLGRGQELEPVWRAWGQGDRKAAAAALPDSLVDGLVVHGSPESCRDRIEAYREAGVTTPLVAVWPYGGEPLDAARALAPG